MYTIRRDFQKEIVIEKSRFICTLKKVASEQEAQDFIKAIKKEYWDATHNCSAYIVDEFFDFVCYVRNDLNCLTKIFTLAFFIEDVPVNAS